MIEESTKTNIARQAQKNARQIGLRIAKLRGEHRTQNEVAADLGIRREVVTRWENGTRRIKDVDIIALADYFGVSCDYLLRGVKSENVGINKSTGLTENTIEILKNEHEKGYFEWITTADFIEMLLTHDSYEDLLSYVNDYYRYGLMDKYSKQFDEHIDRTAALEMEEALWKSGKISLDSYEAMSYSLYEASRCFEYLVEGCVEKAISIFKFIDESQTSEEED